MDTRENLTSIWGELYRDYGTNFFLSAFICVLMLCGYLFQKNATLSNEILESEKRHSMKVEQLKDDFIRDLQERDKDLTKLKEETRSLEQTAISNFKKIKNLNVQK